MLRFFFGKLVVKQEMARVNSDILGISELKWSGMGDFNLDDHYFYCCGKECPRKWSSNHSQRKSLKCSTWMQSQKQQNDLCLFPRQTISVYIYINIYVYLFFLLRSHNDSAANDIQSSMKINISELRSNKKFLTFRSLCNNWRMLWNEYHIFGVCYFWMFGYILILNFIRASIVNEYVCIESHTHVKRKQGKGGCLSLSLAYS